MIGKNFYLYSYRHCPYNLIQIMSHIPENPVFSSSFKLKCSVFLFEQNKLKTSKSSKKL